MKSISWRLTKWQYKVLKEITALQTLSLILVVSEIYLISGALLESILLTIGLRVQSIILYFIIRKIFHDKDKHRYNKQQDK